MTYRLAALLAAAALASCSPPSRPPSAATPQRIISVVPSATETLFAFGLGGRLIAVGDYDEIPREFAGIPRIGGLLNPDIERIIELKPDLVITYGSQDLLQARLQTLGIRLYPFTHGGIEHTLQFMLDLGTTLGAAEESRAVVARIRKTFDDVRAHGPPMHSRVLLVHDRPAGVLGSLYSVGSRAFQSELIEIAGGRNIFADVNNEVLQPTIEEVIARSPDIIVETMAPPLSEKEAAQRKADWSRLGKVPAVVNGRVYIVAEEYLLLPGPRLDDAARYFAEIVRSANR